MIAGDKIPAGQLSKNYFICFVAVFNAVYIVACIFHQLNISDNNPIPKVILGIGEVW